MKKGLKICIIISIILGLLGIVCCTVAACMGVSFRSFYQDFQYRMITNVVVDWEEEEYLEGAESIERGDIVRINTGIYGIEGLDIQVKAGIVRISESSQVTEVTLELADEARSEFRYKVQNGVLYVQDVTDLAGAITNWSDKTVLEVILPEGSQFSKVKFNTGAGQMKVSDITTEDAIIKVGAGDFKGERIFISNNLNAKIGAGQMKMEQAIVRTAYLDCGVGSLEYKGKILEAGDLHCGIGELKMKLEGLESDFDYQLNGGIGNIRIGNTNLSGLGRNKTIDNGTGKLMKCQCGLGQIVVDFD